jgi:D-lactate dehydrogenase (cytochrome)
MRKWILNSASVLVGSIHMKFSKDMTGEYVGYLTDESRRGGCADAIAFAESESDIVEQMREAADAGIPVTVQSGRTGIAGGAVPDGGRILNVSRMTHFTGMRYDEDRGRFHIQAQPGCTLKALHEALMHGGEFDTEGWSPSSLAALERYRQGRPQVFPPDLTEAGACIGGVVACNGSGARTFRYGPTRPHVSALRVVLVGGDVLALRRGEQRAVGRAFELTSEGGRHFSGRVPDYVLPAVKNASGLHAHDDMDLIDLFIGSEGILGVFSEIELALTPLSAAAWGMTAFLPSEDVALSLVERVRANHRKAVSAIEFFSAEALNLLRRQRAGNPAFESLPELKAHWHTAVYVELHADRESAVEEALGELCGTLAACGGNPDDAWLATNQREIETFKGVRHAVPESVNMLISERKRIHPSITKLGTDLSVPDGCLRDVMAMYHRDLRAAGLDYVIFGHIGNNHLHVNILPATPEDYARGKTLYLDWARRVVEMGGSVSAEHGIGKLKTAMLEIMFGTDGIAQMRAVKCVFDPLMLLNRGTLIPQ